MLEDARRAQDVGGEGAQRVRGSPTRHERLGGQVQHDLGSERRRRHAPSRGSATSARTSVTPSAAAGPTARGSRRRPGSETPRTSAPSRRSQSASQDPLKPVCPVSSTRRPAQNAAVGSAAVTWSRAAGPAGPRAVQLVALPQRVHRHPEAVVLVGGELARARRGCSAGRARRRSRRRSGGRSIAGSTTKKPPLMRSCGRIGFSRKLVHHARRRSPGRRTGGGRTAVTVAVAAASLVVARSARRSGRRRAVAVGQQEPLVEQRRSRCEPTAGHRTRRRCRRG